MKVLIVDDESSNRALFSAMMNHCANAIDTCNNGREALDYLAKAEQLPDLILLDINMPVLDGLLTAKEIHKQYNDYWLPIIFLTDDDSSSMLKTCLTHGDDVISKPVDRRILGTRVSIHAEKAQRFNEVLKQYEELQAIHKQQEYEQSVTRNIFSKLMKDCDTTASGLRFYTSPSSVFNGDILQILPRPNGGRYVLLGDVTGHGLPAAICTIPIARTFSTMCQKWKGVGSIARELNKVLMGYLPDGMMCAVTIIEIMPTGELHIWGGGLPDMLVLNSKGQVIDKICSQHMPLGVLDDEEFELNVISYEYQQKDYRLIMYTDGITESKNLKGEFFGEERLEDACVYKENDPFGGILDSVHEFCGESSQDDDISLIEINMAELVQHVNEESELAKVESFEQLHFIPWSMSVNIDASLMKSFQPVPWLISVLRGPLGEIPALDLISTIFSELYNNSLEHGVLGLSSQLKDSEEGFFEYYDLRQERLQTLEQANITIELEFNSVPKPQLIASITDSGEGFDYEKNTVNDDMQAHGRGQLLIENLCSSVQYSNKGRTVCVTFDLSTY